MSKQVTLGKTARENLVKGIDILADTTASANISIPFTKFSLAVFPNVTCLLI